MTEKKPAVVDLMAALERSVNEAKVARLVKERSQAATADEVPSQGTA